MRRGNLIAGIGSATLVLGSMFALAHHGPDKVVIGQAAAKQAPVPFDHAAHVKRVAACDTCHHTQKGLKAEADADVQKCASCHLDPKQGVPSMREMSLTKNPLHANCIGCHKQQAKGPTACKDCHIKG